MNAETLVENDLNCVSQSHLDSKDAELRRVYGALRRKFILSRILRRISFEVDSVDKGWNSSDEWYQSVRVIGVNKEQVAVIQSVIADENHRVALDEGLQDDGTRVVELF